MSPHSAGGKNFLRSGLRKKAQKGKSRVVTEKLGVRERRGVATEGGKTLSGRGIQNGFQRTVRKIRQSTRN